MKSSKPLLLQLFPLFLFLSLFAVIVLAIISTNTLRSSIQNSTHQELLSNAKIIRLLISDKELFNSSLLNKEISTVKTETGIRVTIIGLDGTVLADTDENPSQMDNHGDRPEILDALEGKTGKITRFSHTIQTPMLYVAIPIVINGEIHGVVRTSMAMVQLHDTIKTMRNHIWMSGIIVILLSAFVSYILSRRIVAPLKKMKAGAERYAQGDFKEKIPSHNTEEISGLAISLNHMAQQLHDRFDTILNQRNELEAVLSSMIEGVLAIDQQGCILRTNATFRSFFDIDKKPKDDVTIHEILRHTELLRFIDDVLHSENTLETDITIHRERDYFFQVTGTPLIGHNDYKLGALFIFNDISRIRRLEQVRSDFVANVSHELKTPITAIQGFIETLKDGAVHNSEKAEHFIDIIGRQSNRLNAIITDLLELSRIERENEEGPLEKTVYSIIPLFQSAINDFETQAGQKNIVFKTDCDPSIQVPINMQLMQNAINNLVDNAVKYSNENSMVSLSCVLEDRYVIIRIKDEGNGIPEQYLPRIFERFYRVDKARSRAMGGTGLGLAIVKHIVLAHNGKVFVESLMAKGSTFTIKLPVLDN